MMIDYLCGLLAVKEMDRVTIETHGVGYAVNIPLSTYGRLPETGVEIKLHIHYYVREDAQKLYGFFTGEERTVFRRLIAVSKIGPKVALSILSGVSLTDLVQSVNSGDPSRLRKIPGVGEKTAQRLVMELKGKLGIPLPAMGSSAFPASPSTGSGHLVTSSVSDEVCSAMLSLGYNEKQVIKAMERVAQAGMRNDEPVEAWIRKALQVI